MPPFLINLTVPSVISVCPVWIVEAVTTIPKPTLSLVLPNLALFLNRNSFPVCHGVNEVLEPVHGRAAIIVHMFPALEPSCDKPAALLTKVLDNVVAIHHAKELAPIANKGTVVVK